MITIQHGEEGLSLFFEGSQLRLVHDGEAFHDKAELLHADLSQVSTQVFTVKLVKGVDYIAGKIYRVRSSRRGTILGP